VVTHCGSIEWELILYWLWVHYNLWTKISKICSCIELKRLNSSKTRLSNSLRRCSSASILQFNLHNSSPMLYPSWHWRFRAIWILSFESGERSQSLFDAFLIHEELSEFPNVILNVRYWLWCFADMGYHRRFWWFTTQLFWPVHFLWGWVISPISIGYRRTFCKQLSIRDQTETK